jgi:hypothetical protein
VSQFFNTFESAVRHQLISVDRFHQQGKQTGKVSRSHPPHSCIGRDSHMKVLIYVGTNAVHLDDVPLIYTQASAPRIALIRILQDLAHSTPAEEMQIICLVCANPNRSCTMVPESDCR